MNQKSKQRANANKIKKWLKTAIELSDKNFKYSLPITRLTSVKSLCEDEIAAQKFAFYIVKQVQQIMDRAEPSAGLTEEEWLTHKHLMTDGVAQMENYLANPTDEVHQAIWKLLKQIDNLQGDDYRKIHWTTVHFVRSGYLLKLEYALRCFMARDFQYWAYKLAREYVECYEPGYGDGLTPNSAPMLLEVADFWCQYYFDCPLGEKFPQDMLEIAKNKS